MAIRRAAGAALGTVVIAATAVSCSHGPDTASVDASHMSAHTLPTSSAATPNRLSIPTAAELDTQIKQALDPKLPDSERTDLIEGGAAFRDVIPDMYKALQDNPRAHYGVTDPVFDNRDGTLTATMRLDKDGTGTTVRTTVVHFVHIDSRWKISRTDVCGILRAADYHTPACG